MLVRLCISNFAIISHLEIGFHPGLNILSGETGAGKSIIINAVNLLLGGRASSELIREGADEARVEGQFHVPVDSPIREMLEKMDIPFDGEIIIKRTISRKGKNRITINGSIASLSMLSHLGPRLISISGQHANQVLLNPDNHLYLLDDFANLGHHREAVAERVREFKQLSSEISRLAEEISRAEERQELARFQAEEIDRAGLRPGEDKELEEERKKIKFAEQLFRIAGECYGILYDDEDAVISRISHCIRELERGTQIDRTLEGAVHSLTVAMAEVEEAAYGLRDYAEGAQYDPDRLTQIEDRIYLLNQLKRKYGPSLEDVLAYREGLSDTMEGIAQKKNLLAEKQKALEVIRDEVSQRAMDLSRRRREAARKLESAVEEELKQLHMKGTSFRVRFGAPVDQNKGRASLAVDQIREEGIDEIEFMISPNVGEPLRPLAKIASGGELSRIVLALKSILARIGSVETVVFDEVDAGISGATADIVGEKLLALSEKHQVLCITHLPQIASKGQAHFLVKKQVKGGRTQTTIVELDRKAKIMEIARLLGGKEITDRAISRAEEMVR